MNLDIKIYRHTYNTEGDRNIIGDLHANDEFFCYSLEDEKRADGVKVYGETAIPAGKYKYKVTRSPRFKRDMILIYNTEDYKVVKGEVEFSGVRIHGGNTSKDSHGCPLVAYNTDYKKIWGTAEKALTKMAKEAGGEGEIEIIDAPLTYDKVEHKPIA